MFYQSHVRLCCIYFFMSLPFWAPSLCLGRKTKNLTLKFFYFQSLSFTWKNSSALRGLKQLNRVRASWCPCALVPSSPCAVPRVYLLSFRKRHFASWFKNSSFTSPGSRGLQHVILSHKRHVKELRRVQSSSHGWSTHTCDAISSIFFIPPSLNRILRGSWPGSNLQSTSCLC